MADVFECGKRLQKGHELIFAPIFAVAGDVLRDEDELFRLPHPLRLFEERLHRVGEILPADGRDEAIGAVVGTAFGNFEVLVVIGRRKDARQKFPLFCGKTGRRSHGAHPFARIGAFEGGKELLCIRRAEKDVRFRQGGEDFLLIPLRQAPRDDELFELPLLFEAAAFEDGQNGLLARRREERAGIDDEHLRLV